LIDPEELRLYLIYGIVKSLINMSLWLLVKKDRIFDWYSYCFLVVDIIVQFENGSGTDLTQRNEHLVIWINSW